MFQTKMRAEFIGEDGSMGYRTGQKYMLYIDQSLSIFPLRLQPTIVRAEGKSFCGFYCPYDSWDAFWRNWKRA